MPRKSKSLDEIDGYSISAFPKSAHPSKNATSIIIR